MSDAKLILIAGNPVDGFTYHGPFDNEDERAEYTNEFSSDWWYAELTEPDWGEDYGDIDDKAYGG